MLLDLAAHADRVAVRCAGIELTYAELADRAAAYARTHLGATRRLVMIEADNSLPTLVAYLATVQHGHVALLVPHDRATATASLVERYDPDVVVASGVASVRRAGSIHDLHPELALLLSTSGSTGSPKLVRLSAANVRTNAAAIADYLDLTPADRAATTLPLHYCYGLSVLHSHLSAGASILLTAYSVVDPCFWQEARDAGVTSFAGVPYTFELLESSGFSSDRLPTLRQVTQAGGRMAPARVERFARMGRADGWDLVVMYGQTEATARMAYLPPALVLERPGSIGVPIPGGALRLDPVPGADAGVGELVYTGPNVMMGYAEIPADLARGAELAELRTGDLAREVGGLLEVVGRRGRSAKLFGLRIDLDRVEQLAGDRAGATLACSVAHDKLVAFTTSDGRRLQDVVASAAGLPPNAVVVAHVDQLPTTASGKTDQAALAKRAELLLSGLPAGRQPQGARTVVDDFRAVLGRERLDETASFSSLGGDSLSYVELATRLSVHLPDLPADWHLSPIEELCALAEAQPVRHPLTTRLDTSVLLRAVSIVLIVGSHANLFMVMGGAHVLLAVAGLNFARFQATAAPRAARTRAGLASLGQVAIPSTLILAGITVATGAYHWPTPFFLNQLLGSNAWSDDWQLWFLEAFVWLSLGALALLALPLLDRVERRSPWGFALALVAGTALVRYAWTGIEAGPTERYTIGVVAWCFALGWLAARSRTTLQRLATTGLAASLTLGFFGDLQRELVVIGGLALLTWSRTLPVPRVAVRPLGVVAGASLMVYLTHWRVYPHLQDHHPLLATLASFAVGIAVWWAMRPPMRALASLLRGAQPPIGSPNRPFWKSSYAAMTSALVFMTNGPAQATGSRIGLPPSTSTSS